MPNTLADVLRAGQARLEAPTGVSSEALAEALAKVQIATTRRSLRGSL